jgi:hypothetical protein
MLAIHVLLWALTGSEVMGVFQTLSAGNIGQLGAPGTVVPVPAALAVAKNGSDVTTISKTVARIRRPMCRVDGGITFAVSTAPEPDLSNGPTRVHNGSQNTFECSELSRAAGI